MKDFYSTIKNNSNLFINFMNKAITASPQVQDNFLKVTNNVANTIYKLLKYGNHIVDLEYIPNDFWIKNKNKTVAFVDGGVDKASIISTAPLSIRAGSYIVNKSKQKELFEENMIFLGDLYDPNNELYEFLEDAHEEEALLSRKKDGARIIFEAATLVKHVLMKQSLDYCFLHGPIQAILTPFTHASFPPFCQFAVENILPFNNNRKLNKDQRHFINIYLECIKFIKKSKFPIWGVVETAVSASYIKNILFINKNKGIISQKDYSQTISVINKYRITDTNLFEIILKKNQGLKPLEIQKQFYGYKLIQKSVWDDVVEQYPNIFMGYIKVTDNQCPIRIETLNYPENFIKDYHYILAVSKLLPSYSFPIGLDVVDKFAKIPNWLSKASRNYHTSYLLKKAIAKRDKNTISLAVKILSKKNRGWSNRPARGLRR